MKVFLSLFHVEKTLGPEWHTPLGLLPVADAPLIDQMLFSARKWRGLSVLPAVTENGRALLDWCRETYADEIDILGQVSPSADICEALWTARAEWERGHIILDIGEAVIDANLGTFERVSADVVCLVDEAQLNDPRVALSVRDGQVVESDDGSAETWRASGLWWFRDGATLRRALEVMRDVEDGSQSEFSIRLLRALVTMDFSVAARHSDLRVPLTGDELSPAERLLLVNHRLLGFGRHSEDAIERSYGEDFTVLTPVYLHEDATIDSAVVGPYTSIASGATVRSSVVRNSIIGPGAVVVDSVLDGAIVGAEAVVQGSGLDIVAAERTVWAKESEGQTKRARQI